MKKKEYILTGEEMKRYDRNTVEQFQIPELLLMEQAAMAAVNEIVAMFPQRQKKVLVLSGKGNNGGDAMAAARILAQKGYSVTVFLVSSRKICREDFTPSALVQYDILKAMQIHMVTELPRTSYDIIIDGIIGIGLKNDVSDYVGELLKEINEAQGCKIALDIPSGVCADNGKICRMAFRADFTITFAFLKRGLCFYPGSAYAGRIIKKEIGITEESFLGRKPQMYALCGSVREYLPYRNPAGHKGTFGKVLLIAGSEEIAGAAILAGRAALMSGCGMLRICTHKNNRTAILSALPEAMVDVYETAEEAADRGKRGIAWADVIAIGPGIGQQDTAKALLDTVIRSAPKPLIMDADALNLLGTEKTSGFAKLLLEKQKRKETERKLILTPHPLELSGILGKSREEIQENGLELTGQLAKKLHCVILKKDARTAVCGNPHEYVLNLTGNSGMATAGSGDVLTGITAAMMAVFEEPFEAASVGAYIHGKAGDRAKTLKNEYSILAGDICRALDAVLKEQKNGTKISGGFYEEAL